MTDLDLQQLVKNIFRIDSESEPPAQSPTHKGLDSLSSIEWRSLADLPGSPVTYNALHTLGLADHEFIGGLPCYKRSKKAPFKR
jgi:hypothetical protein